MQTKEYRLDLQTRRCNVSVLTRPWRPAGLPPSTVYDGEANVGPVNIPSEHVTVISFHANLGNNGEYIAGYVQNNPEYMVGYLETTASA